MRYLIEEGESILNNWERSPRRTFPIIKALNKTGEKLLLGEQGEHTPPNHFTGTLVASHLSRWNTDKTRWSAYKIRDIKSENEIRQFDDHLKKKFREGARVRKMIKHNELGPAIVDLREGKVKFFLENIEFEYDEWAQKTGNTFNEELIVLIKLGKA